MTHNKKDLKKLAIRGHSTRGNEVIELLEMMGGINCYNLYGDENYACYIIENGEIKGCEYIFGDEPYVIYSLEEFEEKYPFKVGDKVVYTKYGDNCDDYPDTIESMKWTGTTIEYTFDGCVACLTKDLKLFEEKDKAKAPNLKGEDYSGKRFGYKIPNGYEFDTVYNGKIILKPIKPQYPKNYKKCCQIVGGIASERHLQYDTIPSYKFEEDLRDSLETLRKLIICRNAYWKIAGEQMGLGKPWEPDWTTTFECMPAIFRFRYNIVCDSIKDYHRLLVFPTEEMRDAFYDNFKDMIEQCKELL